MALPGPGNYHQQGTIGHSLQNSMYRSSRAACIAKAQRFNCTTRNASPSPDHYTPKIGLGHDVLSRNVKGPRVKIGNNRFDILDLQFEIRKAKEVPGPGAHERFSEFNQTF